MEGGIARLQSPFLPSRLVDLGIGIGSFWRWGFLLLLAAMAAYGSLIARIRLLIRVLRWSRGKSSTQQPPKPSKMVSDGEEEDDDAWESCSSDEEIEDQEEVHEEGFDKREEYVGNYAEYGSRDGHYEMRWLSELAAQGREIVKAWKEEARSLRPLWDLNSGEIVRSFAAPPAVVLSAGESLASGAMRVQVWDSRTSFEVPAISGDVSVCLRRRVVSLGGNGKVLYVSGGTLSSPAVDLRNVRSPMGSIWEDDCAVVAGGEFPLLTAGYLFS